MKELKPIQDEYGEILNRPETFKWIVRALKVSGSVFIGWTDGHGTHLDILFTMNPAFYQKGITEILGHVMQNNFQRGMKPTDLFVSIIGHGCFGFEINGEETFYSYYDEKLGGGYGSTADHLAVLINSVRKGLSITN